MSKVLLHIGAGRIKHEGFINTDKAEMDITQPWPYEDETVDGIVSMQVLQQIPWRGLVVALREAHRVLKVGGVMRFSTLVVESNRPLEYLLGWNNINLFSVSLLERVLVKHIGFSDFRRCGPRETAIKEFIPVDNRLSRSFFFEVTK